VHTVHQNGWKRYYGLEKLGYFHDWCATELRHVP